MQQPVGQVEIMKGAGHAALCYPGTQERGKSVIKPSAKLHVMQGGINIADALWVTKQNSGIDVRCTIHA